MRMRAVGALIDGGGSDLSHGDAFGLSGSGFGTVTSAAPNVYDDFTSGSVGGNISGTAAVVGTWGADEGYSLQPTRASVSRGVHTRSSFHRFQRTGPESYNVSLNVNAPSGTVYLYLDFWFRCETDVPGETSRNQKIFRVYPASTDFNSDWDAWLYYTTLCHADTGRFLGFGGQGESVSALDPWPVDGTWCHMQVAAYTGTNSTANGFIWVQQDHEAYWNESNITVRNATHASRELRQIRVIHYTGTDAAAAPCGAITGYDVHGSSVYVKYGTDSSVIKRVEAGNNATYANCTVREIQRCTSWSDTAIAGVFNQGALSAGTNYFFVIGETNNVLDTREIQIAA